MYSIGMSEALTHVHAVTGPHSNEYMVRHRFIN